MRHLKTAYHPDIINLKGSVFKRPSTRAIILDGDNILMMYTRRYHDYTLPGGGLDEAEEHKSGMIRELQEETGAQNIRNIKAFGLYEEYRPWYKPDYDMVHIESYCFTCEIDKTLGQNKLEQHEVNNGMTPVWINIFDAIRHNEKTMKNNEKKGLSIERETFLLRLISQECLGELA